IERAAAAVGKRPQDLAAIVPHQVNLRIVEAAVERLEIPLSRVVLNIERLGNTSAGSVPIALDEAARGGRFQPGDLVCLVAFGRDEAGKIVTLRGELMQRGCEARPGAMASVLGLSRAEVEPALAPLSTAAAPVVVANDNSPKQVVISGDRDAVKAAAEALKAK